MSSQIFRYLKIVSILAFSVASIVAEPVLNIPSRTVAKAIKQHSEFNIDSYNFEYYFDDGTVALEVGTIDKINVYGKGYFRFNIQWRLYELRYDSDTSGTRGVLSYLSPTGKTIEELFSVITPESPSFAAIKLSNYHFGQFRLKPNFHMEAFFPPKEGNRPPFSVEFVVKGEVPSLKCQTYENRSEEIIGTTVNQADPNWLDYQEKLKIKILDYENHYDEMTGNYILKYIFDNGLALCELGKLNDDNTVTVVDGHIVLDFKDILVQWNYTSDANQYNVLQINDDRRKILLPTGPHSETQFQLKRTNINRSLGGINTQVYSDGENRFEVFREFTQVNGKPFIRAIIKCNLEYLGEMSFNINERHPYGDPHVFVNSSD